MANAISNQQIGPGARKYGIWPEYPTHSGFTPSHLPPIFNLPEVQRDYIKKRESYQRAHFFGFTSAELWNMDILTTRTLRPGNLQNQILKIMQRDRWEITPSLPQFTRPHLYPVEINGQQDGMWIAQNNRVWEIMKTPLKLASRILMSTDLLPWFDALVNGLRFPIDPFRISDDDQGVRGLHSFQPALFQINVEALSVQRDAIFHELISKWNLQFGFNSPDEDPRGPDCEEDEDAVGDAFGSCMTNVYQMDFAPDPNIGWGIWIFLNYREIESLLRDDLTTHERMMVEWAVANTIVHEIMHATGKILPSPRIRPLPAEQEPYFEEEQVSELGHSFEAAVNGGTSVPFVFTGRGMPMGYWLETEWPTTEGSATCGTNALKLINPLPANFQIKYPIPASFYEDVQQEAFWATGVREFGHKIFFYRALNEGVRIDFPRRQYPGGPLIKRKKTRLSNVRPFPEYSGIFKNKIDELNAVVNASQRQREALNLANGFYESSRVENEFWTNSAAQRNATQAILDEIATGSLVPTTNPDVNRREASYAFMIQRIESVITNHIDAINSLLESERINIGTTYTDRRRVLLSWNRGTGIFITAIRNLSKEQNHYTDTLDEESILLEMCRMTLWCPDAQETVRGGQDEVEVNRLDQIHGAVNAGGVAVERIKNAIAQTRGTSGCSLLTRILLQVCEDELDRNVVLGKQARLLKAQRNLEILNRLSVAGGRMWPGLLTPWIVFAGEVIRNHGGPI